MKRDDCSGEPVPFVGWIQYSDDTVGYEKAKTYDPVNNPKHYTSHPSGVECIEITRHMGFNLGNVVKYLWRAGLKDAEVGGKELEDLKKAMWYLQREIDHGDAQ